MTDSFFQGCNPLTTVIPLDNCACDDLDPPVDPTPPEPECPDGFILACECIPDPILTPCPEDYERINGVCTYIYPWAPPDNGETIVIYPLPDTVNPYTVKYTVRFSTTFVNGGRCSGGGSGSRNTNFSEEDFTILSYGGTTYEISPSSKRQKRMYCRGPNGETYGRTQINGPGADDYNPYLTYPVIKAYGLSNPGAGYSLLFTSNRLNGLNPEYGDRTHSNYGCNTAYADPPNCYQAYFLTPSSVTVAVTGIKIEITGGDDDILDGRFDKEWSLDGATEESDFLI